MPTSTNTSISFTEREAQILDLAAKGFSNHQIAGNLFLCESTVECYRRNMARRMGTKYIIAPAIQTVNGSSIQMDEMATAMMMQRDNLATAPKRPTYLKAIRGGLFPQI